MSAVILTHTHTTRAGEELQLDWIQSDHNAAMRFGWYLDHEDGAIQRDPDNWRFKDVDQVHAYLRFMATLDDQLAIKALIFDALSSADAFSKLYLEVEAA